MPPPGARRARRWGRRGRSGCAYQPRVHLGCGGIGEGELRLAFLFFTWRRRRGAGGQGAPRQTAGNGQEVAHSGARASSLAAGWPGGHPLGIAARIGRARAKTARARPLNRSDSTPVQNCVPMAAATAAAAATTRRKTARRARTRARAGGGRGSAGERGPERGPAARSDTWGHAQGWRGRDLRRGTGSPHRGGTQAANAGAAPPGESARKSRTVPA